MRSACLLGLVAGCGFTSAATGADPGAGAGVGVDGGAAGPVTVAPCDRTDPQLRLCLTFDQDPMKVQDLISASHTLADDAGVSRILGIVGAGAAQFDLSSRIRFAEHVDFDVAELTIDMWIAPVASAGQHHWLID